MSNKQPKVEQYTILVKDGDDVTCWADSIDGNPTFGYTLKREGVEICHVSGGHAIGWLKGISRQ